MKFIRDLSDRKAYCDSRVKSQFWYDKSGFKMQKMGIKNTFDAGVYWCCIFCYPQSNYDDSKVKLAHMLEQPVATQTFIEQAITAQKVR